MIQSYARRAALALLLAAPAPTLLPTLAAGQTAPRLGTVRFPNSGARAAQPAFLRGVLLLHSFEYRRAAAAFREAQRLDPRFALAYWGEAMTWTHPLWNEQWVDSGRAVLSRLAPTPEARRSRAPTARERGYLEAVELLYGDGPKPLRDTLYAAAMERLALAHPGDDEAKAFHALALMGLSQGVRQVPTYMRAGAIALDLFHRLPDHPGAAHYVIHAFDDPTHAPLGLPAARAYSDIAPDAMHAQHMTSHIFVALGMWGETVAANEIASGPDPAKWIAGHPSSWLHYGLLQQGRYAEARRLLETVRGNLGRDSRPVTRGYYVAMRAQHLVIAGGWDDTVMAEPVDPEGLGRVARALDGFIAGYSAVQRGDRAAAERRRTELDAAGVAGPGKDAFGESDDIVAVLQRELRGLVSLAAGDTAAALRHLREAVGIEDAMAVEYGPPSVVKPSHELLGELLLAMGQAGEAQREFTRALALAPRRAASLLGLARAAAAAGDRQTSDRAYADLRLVWSRADAGIPGLEEVTRALSSSEPGSGAD